MFVATAKDCGAGGLLLTLAPRETGLPAAERCVPRWAVGSGRLRTKESHTCRKERTEEGRKPGQ